MGSFEKTKSNVTDALRSRGKLSKVDGIIDSFSRGKKSFFSHFFKITPRSKKIENHRARRAANRCRAVIFDNFFISML